MRTSRPAAIVSFCLLAAVWIGMWLRHLLPEHQLLADSRDTVKLAMGLVATMTALLLGLLVSAAKDDYNATRSRVIQLASRVALLDRMLNLYGTEAAELRGQLPSLIEEAIRRLWPDEVTLPAQWEPGAGDAFYLDLLRLVPQDDAQRALKAQATAVTAEAAQIRSMMLAESVSSISKPMLIVVVLWLVVIFLSFSLLAPPSAIADIALMVSALCVAGAIFLILELDRPFEGLIRISSDPMLNALSQLGKWGL